MKNIFTEHPHSIGESYFQHFKFAFLFGASMVLGGIACIIHAVFPFWFKTTGSNYLIEMTQNFINRTPTLEARFAALSECIEKKKECM